MVFCPEYIKVIDGNPSSEAMFMTILLKTLKHIEQSKEEFKHIKFWMIMAMLCNEPYVLSKYISCAGPRVVRPIRSFLSYAILEDVFEPSCLLEIGRRIFLVLLEAYSKQLSLENVIKQEFKDMDITEDAEIYEYTPPSETATFESVMWKSSEAFRRKKVTLRAELGSGGKICKQFEKREEKMEQIKKLFLGIDEETKERQPSDYIFSDSDNENIEVMEIRESSSILKSKPDFTFEPKTERNKIFESVRLNRPSALYKTIQTGEFGPRCNNAKLFVSTRNKNNKSPHLQVRKIEDSLKKAKSAENRSRSQGKLDPTTPISSSASQEDSDIEIESPCMKTHELQPSDKEEPRKKSNGANNSSFEPPMIPMDSEENESV
jgi:hypothetical protein